MFKKAMAVAAVAASVVGASAAAAPQALALGDDSGTTSTNGNSTAQAYGNQAAQGDLSPQEQNSRQLKDQIETMKSGGVDTKALEVDYYLKFSLPFATFFVAQSALSDPDVGWIRTLAWIPPFSSTVMPLRIAAGVTSPLEMIATIVIMLVAIAVAAVFAARIYENSVLNTGGRQTLKSALNR